MTHISAARWREHAEHARSSVKHYEMMLKEAKDEFWQNWFLKCLNSSRETVKMAERFAEQAEEREADEQMAAD